MSIRNKRVLLFKISHIYIIILLASNVFSQECGNNQCDNMETYINCINDCPITIDSLVWVEDTPVHIDDEYVFINLNSVFLENLIAIQFEIQYDENILELDVENCHGDYNVDCAIANTSPSYLTNTSIPGIIQGIIYSGMVFSIDNQFLNIKFNILGDLGDYSNITINQFEINDIDVTNYTQNGLVTIGNFGCMDNLACNYSPEATFDDGLCGYKLDCLGECGGSAVLDSNEDCCALVNADCAGICDGSSLIDECSECGGDMFIDEYGFYPNGTCDCDGNQPYVYCIDNDGDLQGDPDSSFSSCIEVNQESLVLDCTDLDDGCLGILDDCGICEGGNLTQDCIGECFGNSAEDCEGVCNGLALIDECGECNGEGVLEGICDCKGTLPVEYCIDNNNDGISDTAPLLLCDIPSVEDIFIECETLNINNNFLEDFNLFSAYPNPFNPSIEVSYFIQSLDLITINISDVNGKHVEKLISKVHPPGKYSINWQPKHQIPSGLYFIQITSSNINITKKVNYIK